MFNYQIYYWYSNKTRRMENIKIMEKGKTEISSFKIAMMALEKHYNSQPNDALQLCNLFWNCEKQTNEEKLMVLIIEILIYHKQNNKLLEKYVYQKIVKLLQKIHSKITINYGIIYFIFDELSTSNGDIESVSSKCLYNINEISMDKYYGLYQKNISFRKEKNSVWLRKNGKDKVIYFINHTFFEKIKYYINKEKVEPTIDLYNLHKIKHSWNTYIPFLDYEERTNYKFLYKLSQDKKKNYIYISQIRWGRLNELFEKDENYKYSFNSKKLLILNEDIKKFNPSLIKPIYIHYPINCELTKFERILHLSVKKIIPNFNISNNNIYYYKLNQTSITTKKAIIFDVICSYLYMSAVNLNENQADCLDRIKAENELKNEELLIICIGKGSCIHINNELLSEIYKKHYQHFLKNEKNNQLFLIKNRLINENGLKNLGSTCYMNSGLQCILHCDYFVNYLLNFYEHEKFNNDDRSITQELVDVINVMQNNTKSVIIIQNLRKEFVKKEPKFKKKMQYDSPEFITDFLNQLSIELNRSNLLDPYNNEGKNLSWIKFNKKENSIITDLFYGQFQNQFFCKNCMLYKNHNERFLLFQIPLVNLTPIRLINCNYEEIIEFIEKYPEYYVSQIKNLLRDKYPYIDIVKINKSKEIIEILEDKALIYYNELSTIIVYIISEENILSLYIYPLNFIEKKIFTFDRSYYEMLPEFYPLRMNLSENEKDIQIYPYFNSYPFFYKEGKSFKPFNGIIRKKQRKIILYVDRNSYIFKKMTNIDDSIKLIELIRKYTKQKETITKCENCKLPLELKIEINVLPKYFCIYLKRYFYNSSQNLEKTERMIDYDDKINIYEFVDKNSSINHEECEYELVGVNIHNGSINRGHYYAKCKVENNWYKYDDNLVKSININEYKDKNALVLFYKQKQFKN